MVSVFAISGTGMPLSLSATAKVSRVRVAQRAQGAGGRGGGGEAVAAEHVEVAVLEWREPGDVLVPQLVSLGAELGDGGVDVLRGPEHDGVEGQAERAELVLHAVAVRLVDGAALAVAHVAGQLVAGLLHGEPAVHPSAVGVVDGVDHSHRCRRRSRGGWSR
jgi:hypothetical protein